MLLLTNTIAIFIAPNEAKKGLDTHPLFQQVGDALRLKGQSDIWSVNLSEFHSPLGDR